VELTEKPPAAKAVAVDWAAELARHERWLRAVVSARLGESQAVEEVMQEVALAAVRQQAPLVDPTKTAPWLYRLAVRQVLLYRRAVGRRRKLTERVAEGGTSNWRDAAGDPLDWLIAKEERDLVWAALRRLKPRDAEMLLLKYGEDWSYRQIAEHLGVSRGAVESRLHRARAKLRRELERKEDREERSEVRDAAKQERIGEVI